MKAVVLLILCTLWLGVDGVLFLSRERLLAMPNFNSCLCWYKENGNRTTASFAYSQKRDCLMEPVDFLFDLDKECEKELEKECKGEKECLKECFIRGIVNTCTEFDEIFDRICQDELNEFVYSEGVECEKFRECHDKYGRAREKNTLASQLAGLEAASRRTTAARSTEGELRSSTGTGEGTDEPRRSSTERPSSRATSSTEEPPFVISTSRRPSPGTKGVPVVNTTPRRTSTTTKRPTSVTGPASTGKPAIVVSTTVRRTTPVTKSPLSVANTSPGTTRRPPVVQTTPGRTTSRKPPGRGSTSRTATTRRPTSATEPLTGRPSITGKTGKPSIAVNTTPTKAPIVALTPRRTPAERSSTRRTSTKIQPTTTKPNVEMTSSVTPEKSTTASSSATAPSSATGTSSTNSSTFEATSTKSRVVTRTSGMPSAAIEEVTTRRRTTKAAVKKRKEKKTTETTRRSSSTTMGTVKKTPAANGASAASKATVKPAKAEKPKVDGQTGKEEDSKGLANDKNLVWIGVLVAVIVVGAIAAGIYLLLMRRKKNKDEGSISMDVEEASPVKQPPTPSSKNKTTGSSEPTGGPLKSEEAPATTETAGLSTEVTTEGLTGNHEMDPRDVKSKEKSVLGRTVSSKGTLVSKTDNNIDSSVGEHEGEDDGLFQHVALRTAKEKTMKTKESVTGKETTKTRESSKEGKTVEKSKETDKKRRKKRKFRGRK